MKFKWWSYTYFTVLALIIAWPVFLSIVWFWEPKNITINDIKTLLLLIGIVEVPFIAASTVACQTIKICDYGIIKEYLFFKLQNFSWDEIKEIGINKTMITVPYRFVYFSKRPLLIDEKDNAQKIKDRKNIIMVRYSKRVISCIRRYTDKEIMDLDS